MTPDTWPHRATSLLLLVVVLAGTSSAASVSSAVAQALFAPQGGEIPINLTTAGEQGTPVVSADLEGRLAVVWQNQDASGSSIVARLLGSDGSPLTAEVAVASGGGFCRQAPDVSSSWQGPWVAVWQSEGEDGSGLGVFARRFDASGAPLGPQVQVNQTTNSDQASPRVSTAPDGSFVVVWESFGQDGDGWGIFARAYDASGAPLGNEVQVNQTIAGDQRHPVLALLPGGQRAVVWESPRPGGIGGTVLLGRLVGASGGLQGGEFAVSTAASGFAAGPVVAADGSGNFLVAWQGSGQGIVARRFSHGGSPLSGEVVINTTSTAQRSRPAVASSVGGDFEVAWESADQDQGGPGVFLRRFDFSFQPQSGEVQLNSFSPGVQRRPALASVPSGAFAAVWESVGQDGDGAGVYGQLYTAPLQSFFTLTPCRVFDTRTTTPAVSGVERSFQAAGTCGIPTSARALAVNVTVVAPTAGGDAAFYAGDEPFPGTSTISFDPGQTIAANSILVLARDGSGTVHAMAHVAGSGNVQLVLDVTGYFE